MARRVAQRPVLAAKTLPAKLLADQAQNKSWLIVTASDEAAERLYEDLQFFHAMLGLSPEALALFPEWETLPYEATPPHVELIARRMQTLHRLMGMRRARVPVASAGATGDGSSPAQMEQARIRDRSAHELQVLEFRQRGKIDQPRVGYLGMADV